MRKQFFGTCTKAQCAVCGIVDDKLVFDLDHIIPKAHQGPDEPWNLWTLCLKHHRMKSIKEKNFFPQQERRCWACGDVYSKYFQVHPFWCLTCSTSLQKYSKLKERVTRMILAE